MKLTYVIDGIVFDPRDRLPKYKDFQPRHDPIYYIELTTPSDSLLTYATCYKLDKDSVKKYKRSDHSVRSAARLTKKYRWNLMVKEPYIKPKEMPYTRHWFDFLRRGPQSKLAKAANHYYQKHQNRYIKETFDKPIFTSIVSTGKDTFSHNQCRGFEERGPAHDVTNPKQGHKLEPGDLTGVFISLSNILVLRKTYPQGDLLNQLRSQVSNIFRMYRGY